MSNEADDFVASSDWKVPDPLDKYVATVSPRAIPAVQSVQR